MKKIPLLLSLLVTSVLCNAQAFSEADFVADLTYFKKTLPEKHISLFSKVKKIDFDRKIDSIASRASTLNYETFIAALWQVIVSIGDEHTRLEVNYRKFLPIQFNQFKEGIFATGIDSAAALSLPAQLIAINNYPIASVIERFKTVIQSENESYFNVGLLYYLNNPSFLKGLNISSSDETATYTLKELNGKRFNVVLKAVAKDDVKIKRAPAFERLLPNRKNDHYWSIYDSVSQQLYFNYSKCSEMPEVSFESFNEALFAKIEKYRPKQLIVDLRSNSGGNSAVLTPFLTKIKDSYLNRKGKLFVLIGEKTFSSALMNAVELKRYTKATLVGMPTSGNINHYGEVRGFKLPATKVGIAYSTKYWETWKGKKGPLRPDVYITYSVQNFTRGIDEALAAIN